MRDKIALKQHQKNQLTPQKIEFIELLQIQNQDITSRVTQELIKNPTLEETSPDPDEQLLLQEKEEIDSLFYNTTNSYYSSNSSGGKLTNPPNLKKTLTKTTYEKVMEQVDLINLNKVEKIIAPFLVGSLNHYGFLVRKTNTLVDELLIHFQINVSVEQIEKTILKIKNNVIPIGIMSKNLQECLLLQLDKKKETHSVEIAKKIVIEAFSFFIRKNYTQLKSHFKNISLEELNKALELLSSLNPTPISLLETRPEIKKITPEFRLITNQESGNISVTLYGDYNPKIKIKKKYIELIKKEPRGDLNKFIVENIKKGVWFISAIKRRKKTLLKTMNAILNFQKDFFISQDKKDLKPMLLRHISDEVGMDISTISRIVSKKRILTPFGIFRLKLFFSDSINSTSGNIVSSSSAKEYLKELIQKENKKIPYSDEQLLFFMKKNGYILSRRTISNYRNKLGIHTSNMRKKF